MKSKILFIFIIFSNVVLTQSTADDTDLGEQAWLDYNPTWYFHTNFTLSGSVGLRLDAPTTWKKAVFESAFRYAPNPLFDFLNKSQQELIGGINFYYTYNDNKPNGYEITPFQGYRASWPNISNLKVLHYLRLEERMEFQSGDVDTQFELRARYKFEAIIHWTEHLVDFADGVYIPFSVEFFSNLYSTKNYNNSARVTPGIGFSSESEWKIEFDLSYQFSKYEEESYFTKNTVIYRIRFFQSI